MGVRGINSATFYDFSMWFWDCFDSVVCLGLFRQWYVLGLFRQCGMFWDCFDSVVCFGTVSTVWYVLGLFRQCGMFWDCFDSVVCFGNVSTVVCFEIVSTVWYVLGLSTVWYVLGLSRQCGMFWDCCDCIMLWDCFDSVVCFGTVSTVVCFGTVSKVWYVLFFILFWLLCITVCFLSRSRRVWHSLNAEFSWHFTIIEYAYCILQIHMYNYGNDWTLSLQSVIHKHWGLLYEK